MFALSWLALAAFLVAWLVVGLVVALGFGAIAVRMRGPDDD